MERNGRSKADEEEWKEGKKERRRREMARVKVHRSVGGHRNRERGGRKTGKGHREREEGRYMSVEGRGIPEEDTEVKRRVVLTGREMEQ